MKTGAMAFDLISPLIILSLLLITTQASATSNWVYESFASIETGAIYTGYGSVTALSPSANLLAVGAPLEEVNSVNQGGSLRVYSRGLNGWNLVTILKAATPRSGSQFGSSVALTEDRIIGGAPFDSLGNGMITPFTLVGGTWKAQPEITEDASSQLGSSLAIDSSLLVAGAKEYDNGKGKIFVYTLNGSGLWAKLSSVSASTTSAGVGTSIFLGSGLVASGAPRENNEGCVYLWERTGNNVAVTSQRLTTSNSLGGYALLGMCVVVISNTMIALSSNRSKVYIFTLSANNWAQGQVLENGYGFGFTLAFTSGYLLVSRSDKAFVYSVSGNTISTTFDELVPTEETPSIYFGFYSMSISGIFAVVGDYDPGAKRSSVQGQSVFSFRLQVPETPSKRPSIQTVVPVEKSKSESLGYRVALWNDVAIISIPFCYSTITSCDGGYINVYEKDLSVNEWRFLTKVRNPYRNRENKFGYNMVVNDNYLIVSIPESTYVDKDIGIIVLFKWNPVKKTFFKDSRIRYRNMNEKYALGSAISNFDAVIAIGMPEYDITSTLTNAGCVHMFKKKDDGKWGHRITITAPTPVSDEFFGQSVSMQTETRVAISNNPSDSSLQAVCIFDFADLMWNFAQVIKDTSRSGFGWKIGFISDLLYVSAIYDTTHENGGGSISVYSPNAQGKYTSSYVIQPTTAVPCERFGFSFSTDGVRFVVGAKPCADNAVCNVQGSAYTFTKDGDNKWKQQYRFAPGALDGSDGFGFDVAVGGEAVLVSAPFGSSSIRKGIAYFIKH